MNKLLMAAMLLIFSSSCGAQESTAAGDVSHAPYHYYNLISVDDLKKTIDYLYDHVSDPNERSQATNLAIRTWLDSRAMADAYYLDTLHEALDAWYANNKNWRKIPADLWAKLTERDRGRLRDGIDPELMVAMRHTETVKP